MASGYSRPHQLTPVAEKLLPAKCKATTITSSSSGGAILLSYCPTMDLIALVTEDEELHVFRLNGQRVLGGSFSGDSSLSLPQSSDEDEDEVGGSPDGRIVVRGLAWKDDGHLLAVAFADNTIRILSSYSGKTVHHYSAYFINSDDDGGGAGVGSSRRQPARRSPMSTSARRMKANVKPKPKITCVGWGRNFTDAKFAHRFLLHGADGQSASPIEAVLSANVDEGSSAQAAATTTTATAAAALLRPDLPRELALLDVESSLPKLSTLPSTGSDDDVFSSRASIDAIFHNQAKASSDTVDVLLVGFDDGAIHLRIFDCFEIGTLRLTGAASSSGNTTSVTTLLHASDALSSTHVLLTSVSHPDRPSQRSSLQLLTLDLRFITKSGIYLSLLASKTTQLQNLLRYINQVQRQIELEWKNAQELPVRYMRNINEDLQEKCHCNFVTAVYHLVVTGDCFVPLKEFLVDIVGERGHKRWEKAVTTGYENVRRLTHECLLPALERCQVLLSRLTGLSKFQKLSDVLGLETPDLNAVVQTLDCLHLLAHKILIATNEELTQFVAFSKWLRHEIDMQSAEPMSQTLEELMEKTDLIDHRQTLKYVQGPLTKSDLRHFIRQLPMMGVPGSASASASRSDRWLPSNQDGSFYEHFKKLLQQLQTSSGGEGGSAPEVPKLNDLTRRIGLQFNTVFAKIALTQRRGILQRCVLVLHPDCDEAVVAMTMRFEATSDGRMSSIYIASRSSKSKHILYIYRVRLDSVNGVSSTKETSIAALDLLDGEIRQIQFIEDDTIMLFWTSGAGSSYLLNIPFQPQSVRRPETGVTATASVSDFPIDYVPCESPPRTSEPIASRLDVSAQISLLKHAFTSTGPKADPVRIEANGRQRRRAICVLYGDRLTYEVLDMDAELLKEEDDGGEDEGGSTR